MIQWSQLIADLFFVMISRETLTWEIILVLPHLHDASSLPIVSLSQAWSSWSGPNQIGTSRTVQGEVVWPSQAASSSLGGSDGRPRDLHCRPGKRPPHPQCHHDHLDTRLGWRSLWWQLWWQSLWLSLWGNDHLVEIASAKHSFKHGVRSHGSLVVGKWT